MIRFPQRPIGIYGAALCAFAALMIPGRVEGQETLSALQGVVRNESGHPVEQAQVLRS